MVLSMTGYGKEVLQLPNKKVTVEIKSLNSKQLDLNARMPQHYRAKEMEVRKMVAKEVLRGKVEFSMFVEHTGIDQAASINTDLALGYINQLKELSKNTGVTGDIIATVMRIPDVLRNAKEDIDKEEWIEIRAVVVSALAGLKSFRQEEGKSLLADFNNQVNNIEKLLNEVPQFEDERVTKLRGRIINQLQGIDEGFDKNRLEQEMIFYLEKLDVNEEKVRLKTHINYFRENLKGPSNGKKLGFIAQEMGREINTLGSKANHPEIQKLVVQMKESLEKIKEQVLNTL